MTTPDSVASIPITSIEELKREMDLLWTGISASCAACTDPDCLGYIWVLPEEEHQLLEVGVQTVQVNEPSGPIFIDSYRRDEQERLIVSLSKPRCPYLDPQGRCSVHAVRPLTCHLYPLGPELTDDGELVWGLHLECRHVRMLAQQGREQDLLEQLRDVLGRISEALRHRLRATIKSVTDISVQPDGPNLYTVVAKV